MGRSCRFGETYWLRCILLFALPLATTPFFCSSLMNKRHNVVRDNHLFSHEHPSPSDDDSPSSSFGLYVHIPYCRRRCNYCDFAIVPIGAKAADGDRTAGFERMDDSYKRAILNEIDVIGKTSSSTDGGKIRLTSIYFGGGTPSLAPLSTLRDILRALLRSEDAPFRLDDSSEVTIEMDPGSFDQAYLASAKEMGFNRISLGVQSFDDDLLATMGRVHRASDVYSSIDMIGRVFGEEDANYSIDLISGVPGLTLAGWTQTLCEAATKIKPRPRHMSLYDLQVEKGTAFGKWYEGDAMEDSASVPRTNSTSSRPALPSAEDSAFMYSYASGYLRSRNYEHYEISSYALRSGGAAEAGSSHRSEHNQIYWQYGGGWHAIGLGATSSVDGVRYARPRAFADYVSWTEALRRNFTDPPPIESASDDAGKPPWLYEEPTANDDDLADERNDKLTDVVMTRLRTSEGLDLDWVAEHDEYGEKYVKAILHGFKLALDLDLGVRYGVFSHHGPYGYIRLNDPKGFLFSNNIISNVFVELSDMGE